MASQSFMSRVKSVESPSFSHTSLSVHRQTLLALSFQYVRNPTLFLIPVVKLRPTVPLLASSWQPPSRSSALLPSLTTVSQPQGSQHTL